jgi:hypothetical protein
MSNGELNFAWVRREAHLATDVSEWSCRGDEQLLVGECRRSERLEGEEERVEDVEPVRLVDGKRVGDVEPVHRAWRCVGELRLNR